MLYKLSLDATSMAISYWREHECVCTNIFPFGERILLDFNTREVVLHKNMAWCLTLRSCVFNTVFLLNHWRDVLNYSCMWLCFCNHNTS